MSDIDITRIRQLDFNLLLVFQQLLLHRRTTVVAARLGLSQSAVSHALARLRVAFGEPLFLRRSAGLEPTQTALALGPRVDALLDMAADAVGARAGFDPATSQRHFRIATNDFVAAMLGPLLQSAFQTQAPMARFSVRFATGAQALADLEADTADLVIGRFDGVRASMDGTVLSRDAYHAIARRHHPKLRQPPLTLATYLALPHLLVSFNGEPYGPVDQALSRIGQTRQVVGSVPMFLSALSIVAQGDVIATVPLPLIERYAATFKLAHYPLPFAMDPSIMLLVRHRRARKDAALDWLTQVIVAGWPVAHGAPGRAPAARGRKRPGAC